MPYAPRYGGPPRLLAGAASARHWGLGLGTDDDICCSHGGEWTAVGRLGDVGRQGIRANRWASAWRSQVQPGSQDCSDSLPVGM